MTSSTEVTLGRLADALRAEGGLLAAALDAAGPPADGRGDDPALGALAARGPRAAAHPADIAFVVEAVREGFLLHYGVSRLLAGAEPDLALLAGDRLYALGLARLAALGDLAAVAELADVIALCAQAHAEGRPDVADAVWEAGATAVGWGGADALGSAKAAARAGEADAPERLRAAARRLAEDVARADRGADDGHVAVGGALGGRAASDGDTVSWGVARPGAGEP